MLRNIFIKNEGWLFLFLIALHLFPIWFFDNFATSDGWTHSYNTFLLNEYFFGQFQHFSAIYQINPSYDPNWVINLLQLLVSKVFYWRKGGYLSNDSDGVLTTYSQPFLHVASKIALENKLVYLENVEAKFLYYAIQYKKDKNPFRLLDTNEMIAPRMDVLAYEKETGIPIDYISVWLGRNTIDAQTGKLKPEMTALYQQLDKNTHYKKICNRSDPSLSIKS